MRNVSNAYRQMLFQNKRKYNNTLLITLSDGTELTVTNEHIMEGGIEIDDAVGNDDNFNALGSTIIRSCTAVLYNNDEIYSDYDFENAKVIVKTNLVGASASDELQLGVFTVDEPTYGDSTITLQMLDNMAQFDRPYTSQNIYGSNTTLYNIVIDACTKCGVLYDSSMTSFPNRNFSVTSAPKDDCTYREVIGWCATIAGCFARITDEGKLKFDWFNIDAFTADDNNTTDGGQFDSANPYATGASINGGAFNPWNDPSTAEGGAFTDNNGIHHIVNLRTQNLGVDDVVITGIQVTYEIESNNSTESIIRQIGTDDYIIAIKDNPFITDDNYTSVLDFLQPILIGLQFRTCEVTCPNSPIIEAGDVGYVWDTKDIQHRILITRVTFNPTEIQTIVCGAESVGKNSSSRLSAVTKAIQKSRRQLNEEKSIRQQLEQSFNQQIANSSGLYLDEIINGGTTIIYGHDKPLLADSKMVLKISNGAIAMTSDYQGTDADTSAANKWYGFQFDGTWLANIVAATQLFFDYAHGGTLTLGGQGNGNGDIKVYDANDNVIGSWGENGIIIYNGTIQGPNIIAGGANNASGTIVVKDALKSNVVVIDKDGINALAGIIRGISIYSSLISGANIKGSSFINQFGQLYNWYRLTIEDGTISYRWHGGRTGGAAPTDEEWLNAEDYTGIKTYKRSDGSRGWLVLYNKSSTNDGYNNTYGIAFEVPGFDTNSYGTTSNQIFGLRFYKNTKLGIPVTHINGALVLTPGGSYGRGIFWDNGALQANTLQTQWSAKITHGIVAKPTVNTNEYDTNILGSLYINGNAVSSSSSRRYKECIEDLNLDELDPHKLLLLPVRQGRYKEEYNEYKLQHSDMAGRILPMLIAEEVDEIYPAATIHDNITGEIESWDERLLIPGMLALIQEQQKTIEDLESRLEKLERVIMNLQNIGE